VTPAEATEAIKGYAGAHRIRFGSHARKEMRECGATQADVRRALMTLQSCELQANGRWKVAGPDTHGDALICIVVIEEGAVVVTVF
jgi:hypothetical protein